MDHEDEKKTPTWVWIVVGCSIPVVLMIILFGGMVFFGYRVANQLKGTPEQRGEQAKEVLGAKAIPEGYYPAISLSVPFLFEMTMLSDRQIDFVKDKDKGPAFDEKGLIYVKSIRGNNEKKLRDFIDGKADPSEMLGQGNVRLGRLEPIGRGEMEGAGGVLHWASNRGNLTAHGKNIDGLVDLIYVECKGDSKFRLAVWFGPDPHKGQDLATANYSGTPADESEIRGFMSQFSLCD